MVAVLSVVPQERQCQSGRKCFFWVFLGTNCGATDCGTTDCGATDCGTNGCGATFSLFFLPKQKKHNPIKRRRTHAPPTASPMTTAWDEPLASSCLGSSHSKLRATFALDLTEQRCPVVKSETVAVRQPLTARSTLPASSIGVTVTMCSLSSRSHSARAHLAAS